jgi:tyrosine-specific transport protein
MNFLWLYAVLGALPYGGEGGLVFAHLHGQPATLPLAKYLNTSIVSISGQVFALIAILTSFMSNGVALQHFMGDLLQGVFRCRCRTLEWTLTLGIPLWIVYRIPELFLKALDAVGGIGMVIIFGIIPGLLAVRTVGPRFPRYRTLGYAIGVFFWVLLGSNLIGLLHPPHLDIDPQTLCPIGRK